jgi:hypothetical protein
MNVPELIGIWLLQSFVVEDTVTGERTEPLGPAPAGTIMFHPEGRFFALMTPGDRPAPHSEAEQAAAFQKLIAYSGPYRFEPPNALVTSVDIAWFAPWVGSQQVRYFTLDGDDLTLHSAPLNMPGRDHTAVGVVKWKRERRVPPLP